MQITLSRLARSRFPIHIFLFLLISTVLMPAQASQEVEFVPGFGMSYYFGGKSTQNALVLSAGWIDSGRDDAIGRQRLIDLLRIGYSSSQQAIVWSVAGLPLDESATEKTGLSTGQKWAIGLGIFAGAVYLAAEQLEDELDDAFDEGLSPENGELSKGDTNDNEQPCPSSPVCL